MTRTLLKVKSQAYQRSTTLLTLYLVLYLTSRPEGIGFLDEDSSWNDLRGVIKRTRQDRWKPSYRELHKRIEVYA